nr:hypothetical protein CFP56_30696 [Quercus suber]
MPLDNGSDYTASQPSTVESEWLDSRYRTRKTHFPWTPRLRLIVLRCIVARKRAFFSESLGLFFSNLSKEISKQQGIEMLAYFKKAVATQKDKFLATQSGLKRKRKEVDKEVIDPDAELVDSLVAPPRGRKASKRLDQQLTALTAQPSWISYRRHYTLAAVVGLITSEQKLPLLPPEQCFKPLRHAGLGVDGPVIRQSDRWLGPSKALEHAINEAPYQSVAKLLPYTLCVVVEPIAR